jgi:hypothetical protein
MDLKNLNSNNKGHKDKDSKLETSVINEFKDNILILRNYSFIFVNINKTTFKMH